VELWNSIAATSGGPWEGYVCCAVDAISVVMDAVVLPVVIERAHGGAVILGV
jgi:hypothetical protein